MIMFLQKIHAMNKKDTLWSYILFTLSAFAIFDILSSDRNHIFFMITTGIILVLFAVFLWDSYIRTGENPITQEKSLVQILKVHSFDYKEYGKFIAKKTIGCFSVFVVEAAVLGLVFKSTKALIIIASCIVTAIAVPRIRGKNLEWQLRNNSEGSSERGMYILRAVLWILRLAVVQVYIYLALIGILSNLECTIIDSLFQNNVVVVSYHYTFLGIAVFVIWSSFPFYFTGTVAEKFPFGRKTLLSLCIIFTVFALGMFYTNYTETSHTDIRVSKWGQEKIYSWNEVDSFMVSEQGDALQLTLYMKDGKKTRIISGIMSISDEYDHQQWNDYTFAASLIEQMQISGCKGVLRDEEIITDIVSDCDPSLQDGWRQILNLMK